jgi:pimeloyl-ACP methyl ester carboxylesterase
MREGTITLEDGRTVGFADFGTPDQIAVLWCHGGPSSRLEPESFAASAREAGLRFIGIDRPGYGWSTPQPGRTIGGWVSDAIAVLDHLAIDRFVAVGASTGGAYAMALAASSNRVLAAVACCAVSDMGWTEGKEMVHGAPLAWGSRDREKVMAIATEQFGANGSKVDVHSGGIPLPPSDRALFADPEYLACWLRNVKQMFVQGVAGYADDRLADGVGWGSFNVGKVTCPVAVIHGGSDNFVPVAHARHTATIVPGATLRICEPLGHFSIANEMVSTVSELLARSGHIGSRATAGSA